MFLDNKLEFVAGGLAAEGFGGFAGGALFPVFLKSHTVSM